MRHDLLLLADSRLPAGGHAHSGGLAAAVDAGLVRDLDTTVAFLRGRLATAGLLAAAAAAQALPLAREHATVATWAALDAELDARMPAPAHRAASRAQGRALLRVAATAWPHPALAQLGARPHHPVVLGVACAAAGGAARDAAGIAASQAVTTPASAALRLLGLDPIALTAALAALAPEVDAVAAQATSYADKPAADLPATAAPRLDQLAQAHARAEVRLFAS